MKVVIIGYRNMRKTYANSFISSRFLKTTDIFLFVKENSISNHNEVLLNQNRITKPSIILGDFDIVILSVKPQDFKSVAKQIKSF